jgi:hypothetical protein
VARGRLHLKERACKFVGAACCACVLAHAAAHRGEPDDPG